MFTEYLNTGFSVVTLTLPTNVAVQTHHRREQLRFMCFHGDLNAQISLFCLRLDINIQSEIIMTVSKLPLQFSQSSLSHVTLERAPIFTLAYTPTYMLWSRQEDEVIQCSVVAK